jgi:MscS family membrane protein
VKEMSKLLMWVLSIFWILGSVFHVNIPALITGLGIGGVAIALAGKETVENFFAAFTILSDRPFQVGDSIKLGDTEGVVERIGFRSTRLRNTDGSAFIIPNQSLVSQNLVNLSMRNTRGVKVAVPLRYGIEHKDLMQLVDEIKQALHKVSYVTGSVEVNIDSFEKETIQLIVNYHLPFPLPENINLASAKREINMKVYEIASAHNLGSKA